MPMKRQLFFEPNPILVKELRGRMRGPRAFIFLTAILVLLGLVSYGLLQIVSPRIDSGNLPNMTTGVIIGQAIFNGLAFLILTIVCVVAPSLTASAISGEHQHKTFDLLVSTPLRPATILAGKLLAALSYVALVLLAAVPMMSLAYVFGGVTVEDLLKAFAVMCSFGIAYAVIGLFFSALLGRTGLAVGASYVLLAFCLFGTFFIYIVAGAIQGRQPPGWILATNPISALASVLTSDLGNSSNFSSGSFQSVLWGLSGHSFDNPGASEPVLWHYTAGIYGWLTLVLFGLTTQLIKPVQRFRFRKVTWLLIALFFAGSILAVISVYGPYKFQVVRAIVRWMTTQPYELMKNGDFGSPLDTTWRGESAPAAENVKNTNVTSSFDIVNDNGKRAVHFMNTEEITRTQTLTEVLDKPLPEYGELKLRVVLRVSPHLQIACGIQGDKCPLQLKLDYQDANGKSHIWQQGFYTSGKTGGKVPPRCRTCENHAMLQRVPTNQWYTYSSADLLDPDLKMISPRLLHAVTLESDGAQFDAQVARVSLILHEGRPLIVTPKANQYGWNVRSILPWWITSFFDGGDIRVGPIGIPMNGFGRAPIVGPPPPAPGRSFIQPPQPTLAPPPRPCMPQNGGTC